VLTAILRRARRQRNVAAHLPLAGKIDAAARVTRPHGAEAFCRIASRNAENPKSKKS